MENRQIILREVYSFLKRLSQDYGLEEAWEEELAPLLLGMRALLRPPVTSVRNVHWRCFGCDSLLHAEETSYAENNARVVCDNCRMEYSIHWGTAEKAIYVELV